MPKRVPNPDRDSGHICPACGFTFLNRRYQRCRKCKVALYYGAELMYDRKGFWYHPNKGWITVKEVVRCSGQEYLQV